MVEKVHTKRRHRSGIIYQLRSSKPDPIVCIGGEKFSDSEIARFGTSVMRIDYTDDPTLVAAQWCSGTYISFNIRGIWNTCNRAMSCGCPVIACRNSSIPEAHGDACVC